MFFNDLMLGQPQILWEKIVPLWNRAFPYYCIISQLSI